MLEIFQFIFRDFWTWLGTLILVGAFSSGLRGIFSIQSLRSLKTDLSSVATVDKHKQ